MGRNFERNFDPGVSTIELIFSIFLIFITLLVYAASLDAVPLVKRANFQNVAYHLAVRHMEDLRSQDFSSLPASGPIADPDLNLLPGGAGTLAMSDLDADLKQATITISWLEASGPSSVVLATYIYENGLGKL